MRRRLSVTRINRLLPGKFECTFLIEFVCFLICLFNFIEILLLLFRQIIISNFSIIRREIPTMDDVAFERLDRLSGGKLRHLLVGSPSGYSWNEQVRNIDFPFCFSFD